MKTKELMIGDWVDEGNGFPMQVTGLFDNDTAYLDFEGNEGDVWEEEVKDLKPIPITPEILEKNGFADIEIEDKRSYYDKNLVLFPMGNSGKYQIRETNMFVEYVHEIQHALMLCGIDKEIVL